MKNKNTLPVTTVLVRRQLGWESDVALGQVGRMFGQCPIFQGFNALQQILMCRSPLHFPIYNSYFLLEFSTNAYLQSLELQEIPV